MQEGSGWRSQAFKQDIREGLGWAALRRQAGRQGGEPGRHERPQAGMPAVTSCHQPPLPPYPPWVLLAHQKQSPWGLADHRQTRPVGAHSWPPSWGGECHRWGHPTPHTPGWGLDAWGLADHRQTRPVGAHPWPPASTWHAGSRHQPPPTPCTRGSAPVATGIHLAWSLPMPFRATARSLSSCRGRERNRSLRDEGTH